MYQHFIAVKWVEVDPEQQKKGPDNRVFFKIRYSDGYTSWVPADVFLSGQYIPADVLGITPAQSTAQDPAHGSSSSSPQPAAYGPPHEWALHMAKACAKAHGSSSSSPQHATYGPPHEWALFMAETWLHAHAQVLAHGSKFSCKDSKQDD